jgi:hypothetical protein
MGRVHYRQIPRFVRPFLNDCGIKGPSSRYGDEEIKPGIRRFVFEHSLIFRTFMHDCWVAGLTISGLKSAIGMAGVEIIGFLCDGHGSLRTEPQRVQRIMDWPVPRSIRDTRGFVGFVTYYRMFVKNFSVVAVPIYQLFRKGVRFQWTPECQAAMDELKSIITTAPLLIQLDYSPSALEIV